MADYTQVTDFSAKDALSTGDPEKLILGADMDAEFDAISTAIATKYDSADIASQAQAEAETLNTVLLTPLRLANWSDYNAGVVGDLQALAAPGADRLMFWDHSGLAAAFLTVGTGLAITDTTIATDDANINHDALTNFVADEHVAHSGVTLTAGTGLSGGGTIAASRTFNLDISGLTALSSGLAGTDGFLVDDGGTMKRMSVNASHLPSRNVAVSGNFASTDVGEIVYWTGTTGTLTMPTGIGQDDCFIVVINSGSGTLTIAGSGVTITSGYSLTDIPAGGMATLIRETSTVWFLGGTLQ